MLGVKPPPVIYVLMFHAQLLGFPINMYLPMHQEFRLKLPQMRERVIKQQWEAINVHTSTAYDLENHFFGHKIWVQLDGSS